MHISHPIALPVIYAQGSNSIDLLLHRNAGLCAYVLFLTHRAFGLNNPVLVPSLIQHPSCLGFVGAYVSPDIYATFVGTLHFISMIIRIYSCSLNTLKLHCSLYFQYAWVMFQLFGTKLLHVN